MKELTLEQKIAFCNWYLKLIREKVGQWYFYLCIEFKEFLTINGNPQFQNRLSASMEIEIKAAFPELYEMVMRVGKELYADFVWSNGWDTKYGEHKSFRIKKIHKLKTQLENQKVK